MPKVRAASRELLTGARYRDPRFLLLYPPSTFQPEDSAKPDGSLGLLYLAGALRSYGYDVEILDAAVGPPGTNLQDTFYRVRRSDNGTVRVGMSLDEIAAAIRDFDVVGLSNSYTPQASTAAEVVQHIKATYPEKLIMVGGTNARHMAPWFLNSGADLVFLSEAENTILMVGEHLRRGCRDFSDVPGVAFMRDGRIYTIPTGSVVQDLDQLPLPAWDLAPLEKYAAIARPHGGNFKPEDNIRYASVMTSRGCPFNCSFCHISREGEGSVTGNLRQFRMKSLRRVLEEFDILQSLNVEHVFLEDDSLFAKKKRAVEIIDAIADRDLKLSDTNGVNIVHMCRPKGGRLVADEELFETLARAGFQELTLPFESGSQRIIDKYATGKLDLAKTDTVSLIHTARRFGITVGGNYILGWPDETLDEIKQTIMLAKRHIDAGMYKANFLLAAPFPGTALFDIAIAGGHLSADFNPDKMIWLHPVMQNTAVSPAVLDFLNDVIWRLLNKSSRIANVMSMASLEVGSS